MLAEPDRRPVRPLVCRWRLRLKITVSDDGGVCNCKLQLRFKLVQRTNQISSILILWTHSMSLRLMM